QGRDRELLGFLIDRMFLGSIGGHGLSEQHGAAGCRVRTFHQWFLEVWAGLLIEPARWGGVGSSAVTPDGRTGNCTGSGVAVRVGMDAAGWRWSCALRFRGILAARRFSRTSPPRA